MLITIFMQKLFSTLQPDSTALSLHRDCDKPFELGFNIMEHYKNLSLENIVEEIDGIVRIEEWKPIDGHEDLYLISTFGRVKSLKYRKKLGVHKILKLGVTKAGYLKVDIRNRWNHKQVHRLVGIAFIPNPENKPQINHKKGITTDNRVWELEWSTRSEQQIHAQKVLGHTPNISGLTAYMEKNKRPVLQIDAITGEVIREFDCQQYACRFYGLDKNAIYRILTNKQETVKGYKWRYA